MATAARRSPTRWLATGLAFVGAALYAEPARAAGFDCMRSIGGSASSIMGVPATVVSGGGGVDDCGVNARGYQHIIVTGYVVQRSFFDRVRRTTRTGRRSTEGTVVEYTQRTLSGFGGPAFSLETRSFFETAGRPVVTRSVFVYRNGRMLRPTTTDGSGGKIASLAQLVRLARVANRGF
jgi:hypothetical protein